MKKFYLIVSIVFIFISLSEVFLGDYFVLLFLVVNLFFVIEYIVKFIVYKDESLSLLKSKVKFLCDVSNILDLLACLSFSLFRLFRVVKIFKVRKVIKKSKDTKGKIEELKAVDAVV